MKKPIFLCIVFAAIASLTGCDSSGGSKSLLGTTTAGGEVVTTSSAFTTAQLTVFTEQLYASAISSFSNANHTTGNSYSINYTYYGPVSGSIHISGTTSYTTSGSINTWTLSSMTGSLSNYSFSYNGVTYVMNGTISYPGTFYVIGLTSYQSSSYIGFTGNYTVTGGGISQSVPIAVTIMLNSNASGGTMSGTINGVSVNQSF